MQNSKHNRHLCIFVAQYVKMTYMRQKIYIGLI